jgi:hypothetical protein
MKMILNCLILITSSTAYAQSNCSATLQRCTQVVKDAAQVITDQDKQLINYTAQSKLQGNIIKKQQKQLESPLHDPIKVTVGTGIAVGGAMIAGVAAAPAVAVGVGVITVIEVLFGGG